jgi:isoleucyl-tRNA synthetase
MPSSAPQPYAQVDPQVSYSALEERVLHYWAEQKLFEASIENRPAGERGKNEYVFYDGPPFANGLPHYGHLLTGYVKDIVPRYQTMRGRRVERRFGWDCHGLPAEIEAEKELKISGRAAIESFGIEKFNAHCKRSVLRYTGEWQSYVTRQARWVDFAHDYKTMDLSYMESVMWAFRQLWDKKLIYQSYRVMPYSWAAETPLSNFEIRLDDSYRMRQDPAITVAFTLVPKAGDGGPLKLLAWTTTPWTLPSNLALAVGAGLDYTVVEKGGARYVLGSATLAGYQNELGDGSVVGTIRGKELVGRRYEPLFPFFKDHAGAFVVLDGDFVDTQEGTGIVHMAPGFGEDDQRLCEAHGIAIVVPVDDQGKFTAEIGDWAGMHVFDANKPIIARLKERGVLLRHVTHDHNYPHCWRTGTPLIYKALSSWYVKVTAFRERMVELNRKIRWIPEHVRDGQFGKWLEGARDWSISRNRYWGSPIPIWVSDDPEHPRTDVYGSLAELERDFGTKVTDLHRPFVDRLTRKNPDDPSGKSVMRRVPEVLDCWFESGSMPFAQVHYPFENKEWFESHFPADFIVEYIAQTRGWFYTMVVLASALFDRPPFRNCVCHGVVLDEDGQKLSKRLKNYPDPEAMFRTHGSDALRWFLCSSPILRGQDLQIDKEGKSIGEVVRLVLNPIWNAYAFFTLYANADQVRGRLRADSKQLLDRYLLGKTRALVEGVTESLDAYDIPGATALVTEFLDALNNWYIRRSRPRFWRTGDDQDKRDAYDTLVTVLETLCRLCAPLLPLLAEEVWRGLTGGRSVHLADWPDAKALPAERDLVAAMDRVREVCSVGLSLREAHKLRTRLPLQSFTLAGARSEELAPYAELLRDELNVKEVRFARRIDDYGTFAVQLNMKVLGPRLGESLKGVLAAQKQGRWRLLEGGRAEVGSVELAPGEFTMRLQPKPGLACAALPGGEAVVALDVNVTPELQEEGIARDVVRLVQQARKDAGLAISDWIWVHLNLPEAFAAAVRKHERYLAEQTLADRVAYGPLPPAAFRSEGKVEGQAVAVGVERRSG